METASVPDAAARQTTGSTTIADLLPRAVELFGDRVAQKHKVDGEWRGLTFAELGEITSEIGRGFIDLGIAPGERVSVLCTTRVEWAWCSLAISAAGAVVVPIYPSNSPEECAWVTGNSESVAIVCEDASQVAKIDAIRDQLPCLRYVVVIEGADADDGMIALSDLRARGRARDRAELEERSRAVAKNDPYTFIYTSGTTGPPKGCVLTHGNYRAVLDMVAERGVVSEPDDLIYLFLPLAHAFGLLLMLISADRGVAIAFWGGDAAKIIPELSEVHPTYLPSVPRIFEKLYTFVTSNADPALVARATQIGLRVRELEVAGEEVPPDLKAAFDQADERLFRSVRAAFGGRLREAVTGAAPIAKEILEFFYAAGVPVMEGYGMTETSTTATGMRPGDHRFGSVGRAHPGVEIRIADDGEILLKGANVFQGYYRNDDASFGAIEDGWLHTGDLGRLDDDGFLYITGRKKDIIITAGGKNLTPANLENDLKQTRYVSQAVMHGDRRPFPTMLITLDEEEIVPWAQQRGIEDASIASLSQHPDVRALIQAELDKANAKYARAEQAKKFFILDHDFSQETGELTPTLKIKRSVIGEKYAERFDALYRSD
ncbi:MAG TPA: AMP-dependent synthetase/ligase [Solirubrobacteraceae bacterium]|nr:AMP-dependent synthetase/ligase [Solirubrobacteraceae bacterium]